MTMAMTLADLLEALSGKRFESLAAAHVHGFSLDTRELQPGDVFIAVAGERVDGNDYARAALERGASAVLISADRIATIGGMGVPIVKPDAIALTPDTLTAPIAIAVENTETALQQIATWWRARFDVRVIGVTGSVGKTTTKELIAQVLSVRFNVLKSEGNQNNALGVPLTLLKLNASHKFAVLEMGMDREGEIAAYCRWAQPQIGVLTMVAPVHMERLGSLEAIAEEKSQLVRALPASTAGGMAVLNDDDSWVAAMSAVTKARVVTYGLTQRADVWASDIEGQGLDGVSFVLHRGPKSLPVHLKLLGQHSVHTALRAAAVALNEGMNMEEVVEGLSADPAQLRLVVGSGPHRFARHRRHLQRVARIDDRRVKSVKGDQRQHASCGRFGRHV